MPFAVIPGGLSDFQNLLIGTWNNVAIPGAPDGEGGPTNPLSYCVMPLPQDPGYSAEAPYILKNFAYTETVQFNGGTEPAEPATAPNRGDGLLQLPSALFYQQRVLFGPAGPGAGQVVHAENGAWLNVQTGDPLTGPYPPPPGTDITVHTPPVPGNIVKQMSVPHGNSILAVGTVDAAASGAPTIPAVSTVPTPPHSDPTTFLAPYTTLLNQPTPKSPGYQNPSLANTANPNAPVATAVGLIAPTNYIKWSVKTDVTPLNIPFEVSQANVTAYSATYWLLSTDGGTTYPYLAYSQNISMQFMIGGTAYNFPHVTANVVTKG